MTASVVLGGSASPANVSSINVAVASTPAAGDTIYLVFDFVSLATTFAVSGLGATWTQESYDVDSGGPANNSATHVVWKGVGANASGNIATSWNTGRYGIVRAFIVSGVTSPTLTVARVALPIASPGTSITGPSQTATTGDVVINFWFTGNTGTSNVYPSTSSPSGWTTQTVVRHLVAGNFNTSFRVPSSSAAHQLQATSPANATHWMTQLLISPGGPAPITGSVTATRAATTAAVAGTVTAPTYTGVIAATRAPHVAAVAGTVLPPTRTVVVDATGPAHTASIAGTVVPDPRTGVISAVGPAHTAAIDGTAAEPGTITGAVDATGPAHTAGIAGTTTAPSFTGTLAATGPAHAAAIAGNLTGSGSSDVTLSAVRAPHQAVIYGEATSNHLEPWTADLSRRTLLPLVTSGSFDFTPPLAVLPTGMTQRVVWRRSIEVPQLRDVPGIVVDSVTNGLRVPDPIYDAFTVIADEPVGVLHVLVSGVDVTYFRDSRTIVERDRAEEPFGDSTMRLSFPQITTLDIPGDGDLTWLTPNAPIQLVLQQFEVDEESGELMPTGTVRRLWAGDLISDDSGNDPKKSVRSYDARGSLFQAATVNHQVPVVLDQTDIGTLVPRTFNAVPSRRYPKLPNKLSGLMSRQRGSWSDTEMDHAQNLLATAYTTGGRQLTVGKISGTVNSYEVRVKRITPVLTVTNGQRGVEPSLSRDMTQIRNVIWGQGVGPDGYGWFNTFYPGYIPDDAPAYPGTLMSLGSTDATSSGGVSVWQQRVRDLGWTIAVDGVIGAGDVAIIKSVQKRYGLAIDGIIGPQTWTGTFDVGANGGDLTNVIRLPLAADTRTQKWLYTADGSIAGPNPDYDKSIMVVSDFVDFGPGTTRAQGVESAQQIIDRESFPSLTGTIVLRSDPREMSRLLIEPGMRITILGYEGTDPDLHIASVERNWQDRTVTLTVDQYGRDAMTLASIRKRNKESRRDPARRPGNVNKRSRLDMDQIVPFDGESPAGRIPRTALYPGLWSVRHIPVSTLGRVAQLDIRTSAPTKFAFALFGAPIKPAHLVKYVGSNPLALSSPYEAHLELLEDRFGFIDSWGTSEVAAGEQSGRTFGRLMEGGFEYVSAKPPWIWVAMWSPNPTWLSGRILPATDQ